MKNIWVVALIAVALCLSSISSFATSTAPEVQSALESGMSGKAAGKSSKVTVSDVDINSADAETLILLPGIGPKTAAAIIEYRTSKGGFKSLDELKEVKGIGDKTLAKLKPYLKNV